MIDESEHLRQQLFSTSLEISNVSCGVADLVERIERLEKDRDDNKRKLSDIYFHLAILPGRIDTIEKTRWRYVVLCGLISGTLCAVLIEIIERFLP